MIALPLCPSEFNRFLYREYLSVALPVCFHAALLFRFCSMNERDPESIWRMGNVIERQLSTFGYDGLDKQASVPAFHQLRIFLTDAGK